MLKDNSENKELNLMISVVKKYYELGMNQEQIAKEEFISKSSVCRLIKKAVDTRLVTYKINYPVESVKALEDEFYRRFDLKKVFIEPAAADKADTKSNKAMQVMAEDVCKMVKSDDILAINWGNTIDKFANTLAHMNNAGRKCKKVVLINGSLAGDVGSLMSSQSVGKIANFFGAEGFILPAPLVVDSREVKELIINDSHVAYVMDMIRESQFAIMSIGGVSPQTVLMRRNAYNKEEYDRFMEMGAVGDMAGWYFDINGRLIENDLVERTISLPLDEVNAKETRIGIAMGNHKVNAIIGALRGGYVNMLYTDEPTAKAVMDFLIDDEIKF